MDTERKIRGRQIAEQGQIARIDETHYTVGSQSGSGTYDVMSTELGWFCSCKDHAFKKTPQNHKFYISLYINYPVMTNSRMRSTCSDLFTLMPNTLRMRGGVK